MAEKKELENKGYIVYLVTTGKKAIETITQENLPVDLILMDIDLGSGIDGTQAAQIILKEKDIPIVFLSSHTEPEIVEKTEKISASPRLHIYSINFL
ncbi:response regulator [Salinispira pacifica]|uniref:response regulator n=1 Tax=Salinispira pacifica TaxID=1307761 RepID=UPI00244D9E36|nr:response regulator [Salinispira pacifica]